MKRRDFDKVVEGQKRVARQLAEAEERLAREILHEFLPDTWGRDQCDRRIDDDGRIRMCGRPRREHAPAPAPTARAGEQ